MQVFLVKGNYMTLAVKPKAVELGEWIAHQVYEQYQTLTKFVGIIQAAEPGKPPLCNLQSCPTMSAGGHTYSWLDINRNPTRLPAYRYIELVQRWIATKIQDTNLFPTDSTSAAAPATYASGGLNTPGATTPIPAGPTSLDVPLSTLSDPTWIGKASGFPESFFDNCRNIFKQMLRIYAHLYWHHFEMPLYHLDMERWLNSSFMLFVIVGTELDLLSWRDLDPIQCLLDKWYALEKFPADCRYLTMYSAMRSNNAGQHQGSTASAAPSNAAAPHEASSSPMDPVAAAAGVATSSVASSPAGAPPSS
ncbi:MAG: hypothetical protein M1815_000484 [Lichina confinis]|nr:MAG: hypothetical protein M1815_000484 [Lichina confinis]